ncbi:hypothetical protein BH09PSE4_BH09PSE4_17060 [soil metagenome]
MNKLLIAASAIAIASLSQPAFAKDAPEPALTHCDTSLGTIAVVDGDTQGWTKYNLGSPRDLIAQMATQSGCFTIQGASSGQRADFLMNAVAGDKEEVNQAVNVAKTALIEGAVRSGAVTSMITSRVPFVGGMLGGIGGLGGKKKTYAAGLRVISPATGMTVVSGTGESKSSSITFAGFGDTAGLGNYGSSKEGKMLSAAFIQSFNDVVAQGGAISAARAPQAPIVAASAPVSFTTAIDTKMYSAAAAKGAPVRALRASTALTPTGKREGLFVEVKDAYGTTGWVSVEDLK